MAGRDTQGDIGTPQLRTRVPDPAYGVTFYQRMESSEAIAGVLMRSSWQPLTERQYPERQRSGVLLMRGLCQIGNGIGPCIERMLHTRGTSGGWISERGRERGDEYARPSPAGLTPAVVRFLIRGRSS
jgi:hypothetical protein